MHSFNANFQIYVIVSECHECMLNYYLSDFKPGYHISGQQAVPPPQPPPPPPLPQMGPSARYMCFDHFAQVLRLMRKLDWVDWAWGNGLSSDTDRHLHLSAGMPVPFFYACITVHSQLTCCRSLSCRTESSILEVCSDQSILDCEDCG